MDTKFLYLLGLIFLFFSCDPDSVEKSFRLKNNSNSDINILLYENGENLNPTNIYIDELFNNW